MHRNRSTWDFIIYNFIIKKKNKLIAEFMDVNLIEGQLGDYHTSWDWLMPVVEKIKRTDLSRDMVMQGMDELIDAFDAEDIETTYQAVVEFIKQHNKES